ncbi:MAG TPA: LptF/LptG family permease [Balneolales bacterium]|nr:LptF/LptG family permease [Balneolales bacterium]
MNKIDRYIISRLFTITVFVLVVLIFIFVVIDFSQNSDEFTDHGATIEQVLTVYYANYVPEIIRLVTPVAVFIACLLVTGQMADRIEIVALKAAGVSLYRLLIPYLLFAFFAAGVISYLDGFIVPKSNVKRIDFEHKYLNKPSQRIDKSQIFRQESKNSILMINYFDPKGQTAYHVRFFRFKDNKIVETLDLIRMEWKKKKHQWMMYQGKRRIYTEHGVISKHFTKRDTTLNIYPRDLARTTTDVYQLTYPEIIHYIQNLERSGAGNIDLPKVQFYSKLAYPFSIIVVILIGVALAAERRRGGRGVHIAYGLTISFIYLVFMKMTEPFGNQGDMPPLIAAIAPHLFFFIVGIFLFIKAKK